MQVKTIFAFSASAAFLSFAVTAYSAEPGVMALTPSEMKWSSQGGLALPGLEPLGREIWTKLVTAEGIEDAHRFLLRRAPSDIERSYFTYRPALFLK